MPGRRPPSARYLPLVLAVLLMLPAPAAAQEPESCAPAAERAAVLAELNAVRVASGLAPVRRRPALGRAACAHASDMVARRYFSHTSPDGLGPGDRVRASGYVRNTPAWRAGEILLWARAPAFTAADAAQRWLASPPHRAILLSPDYRDAGVGVVAGAPAGDPANTPAVTMAVVFGARARAAR